jgi:hypothetical protein
MSLSYLYIPRATDQRQNDTLGRLTEFMHTKREVLLMPHGYGYTTFECEATSAMSTLAWVSCMIDASGIFPAGPGTSDQASDSCK